MTKGTSEGKVRIALNSCGLNLVIYKPPDDARNWKPADFLVWWEVTIGDEGRAEPFSAMIEVKECKLIGSYPLDDLRPSQRTGIRDAKRIGLPYLLVIWWRERKIWTVSDGIQLDSSPVKGSVAFSVLAGRIGIDAQQDHLAQVLRAALTEGLLDGKGV